MHCSTELQAISVIKKLCFPHYFLAKYRVCTVVVGPQFILSVCRLLSCKQDYQFPVLEC